VKIVLLSQVISTLKPFPTQSCIGGFSARGHQLSRLRRSKLSIGQFLEALFKHRAREEPPCKVLHPPRAERCTWESKAKLAQNFVTSHTATWTILRKVTLTNQTSYRLTIDARVSKSWPGMFI